MGAMGLQPTLSVIMKCQQGSLLDLTQQPFFLGKLCTIQKMEATVPKAKFNFDH